LSLSKGCLRFGKLSIYALWVRTGFFTNAVKLRSQCFSPLFEKEGLGEIFLINPPQSPFVKGGSELNLTALVSSPPTDFFRLIQRLRIWLKIAAKYVIVYSKDMQHNQRVDR